MVLQATRHALALSALLLTTPSLAQQAPHAGQMDHGDHSAHANHANHANHAGHGQPASDPSPGPTMETPPPPEAGSGPPRAADAIWGADVMRAARKKEHGAHGNFATLWVQVDRLETQLRQGGDGYLWDVQGYYGSPTSRLWIKSEGEGSFGEKMDDAEVQALWSKAVAPYWDVQLGARQDVAGHGGTHAVLGVQGLAPYFFEVDAAAFLSHRGDLTARVEAELDQRITQQLVLQPRAEVNLAAQNNRQLGIGAGINKVELGVRLRYEFKREFAPYIGVEQSWHLGNSATFARAKGEDPHQTALVVGIRFWF